MNTFGQICRRSVMAGVLCLALSSGGVAMAVEEAAFTVEVKEKPFEIRLYAPQCVAETVVEGDLEDAGNRAFGRLFDYISGANRAATTIAMTAPVGQRNAGQKIAMTAPVGQRAAGDRWVVSFMMPASFTMESLPVPDDPLVVLREVPAQRMAVIRYSGFWSEKGYRKNLARLQAWMADRNVSAAGEPVWARYNPPFTPWFLRRNEILVPVAAEQQ